MNKKYLLRMVTTLAREQCLNQIFAKKMRRGGTDPVALILTHTHERLQALASIGWSLLLLTLCSAYLAMLTPSPWIQGPVPLGPLAGFLRIYAPVLFLVGWMVLVRKLGKFWEHHQMLQRPNGSVQQYLSDIEAFFVAAEVSGEVRSLLTVAEHTQVQELADRMLVRHAKNKVFWEEAFRRCKKSASPEQQVINERETNQYATLFIDAYAKVEAVGLTRAGGHRYYYRLAEHELAVERQKTSTP